MEVVNLKSGKPSIVLYNKAKKVMESLIPKDMKASINVSLSDDAGIAHAIVIIEAIKK